MVFDLNLLLIGLILMVIGQLVHQIFKIRREIKDANTTTFNLSDYWNKHKFLVLINLILVILIAGANSFIALLPITAKTGLLGAGYAIDSAIANMFGDKLKNGK